MTSSTPLSGTLEVAAALAFHLPGARLDLSGPNGSRCCIGPLTDPRSQLHPAEFRELVVVAGSGGMLGSMLGCEVDHSTKFSLAASEDVEHLGGGLYRVSGGESVSFTFATTLRARRVEAALSSQYPPELVECRSTRSGCQGDPTVAVSLIEDDGLGVTLVVICAPDIEESHIGAGIAQHAMSACLVAELEGLTAEPESSGSQG